MAEMNQIDRAQQDGVLYPLTHPQKRIWYIEKLYPNTSLYNIGGTSKATGRLDFKLLEEALNGFIHKNDGIRLRFSECKGEVSQYISDYQGTPIDFFDFSSSKNPELEFNKWALAVMKKPFVLMENNLYYFAMFKINESCTGFLGKFHHIIADGWSINILCAQVYEIYQKLSNGEEVGDETGYSYLEYIKHEQAYLNSERLVKNRSFWTGKFAELPEPIFTNSLEGIAGKRATYNLEKGLSQRIKEFTAANKCSLNTFFTVLFLIYLYKSTQHDDLVIGTPVLNRSGEKEKNIFGMFTSTMPFRFWVDQKITALQMVKQINEELRKFYFHQKYPYDLLVQDLELKKKGYDNLFQVSVNYYNTKINTKTDQLVVETEELYNGNQFYLLQLVIKDWANQGHLTIEIDYKLNEYTTAQIDQIFRSLLYLTEQMLDDASIIIRELNILPENDRNKQIYDFNSYRNDYPREKTVAQLFEEQVGKTPDRVTVCFEKEQLTYRELNEKSNQLARVLRDKGLTRDAIVGLMVTHSIEALIAILAVIKAGGAYLPIDPEYPADRIEYMLVDSGCQFLLTNCVANDSFSFRGEVVALNDPLLYTGACTNLESVNKPQDLVYIIYTSGSTGKPKGVMIEHQGLVNYIWWAKQMYIKNEDDAFALYSSLSFDLTVTSIFTPLISGNRIVVYRDDKLEYVLFKIMRENKVSVVKLTPSHLSLLQDLDNRSSSVKRFIVGGEDLKTNIAAKIHQSFGGNIEIYNEYGPTETVVGCMIHKYDYDRDTKASVPIGVPADNVQIYILDQNRQPLPEGSIGELYISGDGVARGYLNRVDLSNEKFLENPYIKGKRIYKTGDLARFLSNGKIDYVGRADQQVKIRGYRIELGEIEKLLLSNKMIDKAVVIDRQNVNGDKYLCAYIVVPDEAADSNKPIVPEIKDYLLKYLPEYMVPLQYVIMDTIPLTQNGKVNRSLLPEPKIEELEQTEDRAPTNAIEKKLFNVVQEILGTTEIKMGSSFFHYGGDSIKAIQIAAKLNELGLKIKVRDILSHPVIAEMAMYLEYETNDIDQSSCAGSFKLTPIYAWFFAQNFRDENHYNQSVVLDWKEDISVEQLRLIMAMLVNHHDSLRLNYNRSTGELFYNNNYLKQADLVQSYDLSMLQPNEQDQKLQQLGEELKSGFDIEKSVLIKAGFFNLGSRGKKCLLTAHHLIVDGISWRILLEDIHRVYDLIKTGEELSLPPKTHSLQEWSHQITEQGKIKTILEREYWARLLDINDSFPVKQRPDDLKKDTDLLEDCAKLVYQLSPDQTGLLIHNSGGSTGVGPYELLITALCLTIRDFTGNNEVVIELEGHGREEIFDKIDVTRTVGWFTSIYPASFRIAELGIAEKVKTVKAQLGQIPHHGIGFGILQFDQGMKPVGNKKYVRFNYLGDFNAMGDNEYFSCKDEELGSDSSRCNHLTALIDINAMINNGQLMISLTYSKNRFDETTINDFMRRFDLHIHEILTFKETGDPAELTQTDFELVKLSQDDLESLFV